MSMMNTKYLRRLGNVLMICVAPAATFGERVPVEDELVTIDLGTLSELHLVVNVIEGNLTVIGEDRSTVELEFGDIDEDAKRFGQPNVNFDSEEGRLRVNIGPQVDDSDLIAKVPAWSSVKLDTKDGDIRIENISGGIDAQTIDGDIELLRVSGGIAANSIDGDIRIELTDTRIDSPMSLATIDGDIEVIVKGELHANFNVSTIDGDFESDLEFTSSGKNGRSFWGGLSLEGKFGDGGATLSLKTIDGDVEVKR